MAWTGSPGAVLPKLEYAQRLIAALALVLIRQRDATGLIVFDDDVRSVTPPRARLSHWRQLLQVLAIKLRQMEGATLEALSREFAGMTGDLIERRVASALGTAPSHSKPSASSAIAATRFWSSTSWTRQR